MSDEAETEVDNTPPYNPPDVSFRLLDFVDAAPEEITKRLVECKTCPVFMLCESEQAGTGYVCKSCKMTGLNIDEPKHNEHPNDVVLIDCKAHKFKVNADSDKIEKCAVCSGDLIELELRKVGPRHHLIETVHATNPPLVRQKALRDARDKWVKILADRAKNAKKKKKDE